MITPDANLLIYAYDKTSRHYSASQAWLVETLNSHEDIGIPAQAILAFIRIGINPNLPDPFPLHEALAIVDTWLERPNVFILNAGEQHWTIFRKLCLQMNATAKLTTDLHLAALAIEHGATFYSADRDFSRIPGLRLINPLPPKTT